MDATSGGSERREGERWWAGGSDEEEEGHEKDLRRDAERGGQGGWKDGERMMKGGGMRVGRWTMCLDARGEPGA